MSTPAIVMTVILVVLIIACIVLYFFGKKAQKKQAEQQEQMDAAAQTVSMLVIDKKKMKLKEAGLPAIVLENTPKYQRTLHNRDQKRKRRIDRTAGEEERVLPAE